MNAPDPMNLFLMIDQLEPSKTNPRKRFDPKKLDELASSIQTQGILQPILVRPIGESTARFEIIAGERRWRASKLAGLKDVPVIVRNLTDLQVLHAQVIENLQRDDLHPLEEAEGYERLLQEKTADGKPYTVDLIAEDVGKSKRYVYARIQLLDLCEQARDAFFEGRMSASTALLIAAIPVQKLQLEALEEVAANDDSDEMSFRDAKNWIRNRYMTDLAKAPFDIKNAKLLAKVGSCTECTSRTGNQPGLFDAIESEDVCTNASCYAMKKAAHILAVQTEAEKHGHIVIKGEEAKKAIPNYWQADYYFQKNDMAELDDLIDDDPQQRTWRQVLDEHKALKPDAKTGKPPVQKTVIENPHQPGTIMEGINIEQATKALREMGFVIERKEEARNSLPQPKQKSPEQLAKEAEQKARLDAENAYRLALFQANGKQIAEDFATIGVRPGMFLMLAKDFLNDLYYDDDLTELLAEKYLPGATIDELDARLHELSPQQHLQLIFDIMMLRDLNLGYLDDEDKPDTLLQIAGVEEVDHAAIRAAHEYKAPAAAPAKKAAKSTTKEKA